MLPVPRILQALGPIAAQLTTYCTTVQEGGCMMYRSRDPYRIRSWLHAGRQRTYSGGCMRLILNSQSHAASYSVPCSTGRYLPQSCVGFH
jgi:hypothetical protein